MKPTHRLLNLAAVTALFACQAEPSRDLDDYACELAPQVREAIDAHPRSALYQNALMDAVAGELPGAVWAVRDADGLWIGAVGSADLETGAPLQPCHRTRIASVTKSMVSATTLQLVQDGLIALDDPIENYLTGEWLDAAPRADRITVRHLLSHSSGLDDYLDVAWGIALFNTPDRTWTTDELLRKGLAKDLLFQPGARHEYANTNYLLLGKIIEAVTGRPHEEVMNERVFEPLTMDDTTYVPDAFEFEGVARAYLDLYGDRVVVDATDTFAVGEVSAAGGVISTAADLIRFLDGTIAGGGILDDTTLQEATDFVPSDSDHGFLGYGLGLQRWDTDHGIAIGHTGQELGYLFFAYHFPDADLSFVLWSNAASIAYPTEDNLTGLVMNRVLPALVDAALADAE